VKVEFGPGWILAGVADCRRGREAKENSIGLVTGNRKRKYAALGCSKGKKRGKDFRGSLTRWVDKHLHPEKKDRKGRM